MSLKSLVIPGTNEDEYFTIFEITDQAYLPNLSSLEIKDFKSTLSEPILIFLTHRILTSFKVNCFHNLRCTSFVHSVKTTLTFSASITRFN